MEYSTGRSNDVEGLSFSLENLQVNTAGTLLQSSRQSTNEHSLRSSSINSPFTQPRLSEARALPSFYPQIINGGNQIFGDWRFPEYQRWLIESESGFIGEPSTSIRANQNSPFRYNAASTLVSRGGGLNVMSTENLNLNCGVVGQNSFPAWYQNSRLLTPDGLNHEYLDELQDMLSSRNQEVIKKIFEGVLEFIFFVMIDRHGHQFFNKLIEAVNNYQLQLIVAKITLQPESFISVLLTPYGSKSVNKLIKKIGKTTLITGVISTLSTGFYRLMTDLTGSSVILRCLNIAENGQNELLYLAALRHCLDLAEHEKGCISINKFITNSRGPGRDKLLHLIAVHSVYLSQDPSGNYVLQHVIGLHDPVFTEKICCLLRGNYVLLSSQQGGSHVVEKCLNSPWMDYVILDFLKWDRLWQLARDRYGNYVIQTALKVTKRANIPLHRRLLEKFQGHLDALRSGYGRNVINLIVRGVPLD